VKLHVPNFLTIKLFIFLEMATANKHESDRNISVHNNYNKLDAICAVTSTNTATTITQSSTTIFDIKIK